MKEFLDDCASFVAWHLLPRRVVLWCAVRVIAHASVVHAGKEMDAITPSDCVKAWKEPA